MAYFFLALLITIANVFEMACNAFKKPTTHNVQVSGARHGAHPHEQSNSVSKKKDTHIAIRGNTLLYIIIALLVLYIVDKELLILPAVVLALAVSLTPILAPPHYVEGILDLSAFQVDWSTKTEVRNEAIIKYIEVEKPTKAMSERNYKDAQTQFEEDDKPVIIDEAALTSSVDSEDFGTLTDATTLSEMEYGDRETMEAKEAASEKSFVLTYIVMPLTTKHVDQGTSTAPKEDASSSTQTMNGTFVTATAAQEAEMRHSQAMRDRSLRPGIHPSQRAEKWIEDDIVEEINRANFPIPDLTTLKHQEVMKDIEDAHHAPFPAMPAPRPGSKATQPNYIPWNSANDRVIHNGHILPSAEYFGWVQTAQSNVYFSAHFAGHWLVHAGSVFYCFIWSPGFQMWWCDDYGFGFYETGDQDEPYHFFYGDAANPTENMMGPNRVHPSDAAGPYYEDAKADFIKVFRREDQEEVRKREEAEELEREVAMGVAVRA
jgi:hypothetical protein